MSEFKVGDRIRETETGDIGVIIKFYNDYHDGSQSWWVKWETGMCKGDELHINSNHIEHCEIVVESVRDLSGTEIVIDGVTYILQRK